MLHLFEISKKSAARCRRRTFELQLLALPPARLQTGVFEHREVHFHPFSPFFLGGYCVMMMRGWTPFGGDTLVRDVWR